MSQVLTFSCVQVTSTTTTVTVRTKTTSCRETKSMTLYVCPLKTSHMLSQFWHVRIGFSESCRYTILQQLFEFWNTAIKIFGFIIFFCRDLSLLMALKFQALLPFWNCTTDTEASYPLLLHCWYYLACLWCTDPYISLFLNRRRNPLWYNRWQTGIGSDWWAICCSQMGDQQC